MKKKSTLFLLFIFTITFLSAQQTNSRLNFRENKGQVSDQFYNPRPDVLFSGSDGIMNFHLKKNGISYQVMQLNKKESESETEAHTLKGGHAPAPLEGSIYRIDVNFLNANINPEILKGEALPGAYNFYLESCPEGALGVQSFKDLTYKSLYTGIDLKWYEKNGSLEYDFLIAPHADYKQIQLRYEGAENISVNSKGELVIGTPLGILIEEAPVVTQNNKALPASWFVKNSVISFDIKNIDPSQAFVIDPIVRLWATYFGGSSTENSWFSCTDPHNNVYISGNTQSTSNIATTGAFQTIYGGNGTNYVLGDAYIAQFHPNGSLKWATYFGGDGCDFGNNCACDASGNIYMTGGTTTTNSAVMTTSGCHQAVFGGGSNYGDAFLLKLNGQGLRQWSTYYGGENDEWGLGVSTDISGDVYLCGGTTSTTGIATNGSHQPTIGGSGDAYFVKFSSVGVRQWGTYYGGSDDNNGHYCTTDKFGFTYLCGRATLATSVITTPGSHQATFGGGAYDGFLVKFNAQGQRIWGTYYGGPGSDFPYNCTTDSLGKVYMSGIAGNSTGTIIATTGAHQTTYGGAAGDLFLVVFDSSGVRQWATYYGGAGAEDNGYCVVDKSGHVYLNGFTSTLSGTAIATPCTYQTNFGGGARDALLAKFTNSGARIWGTYYGGTGREETGSPSIDGTGAIYIIGNSSSAGTVIPSASGYQSVYGGGISDAFLVKFDSAAPVLPVVTVVASNSAGCTGETSTLTATGVSTYSWSQFSSTSSTVQIYLLLNTTYTVIGTDAYGCNVSGTVAVKPNLCLGIEKNNSAEQLTIFPNPNNGLFTIQSSSDENFILINAMGQTLKKFRIGAGTPLQISEADLPSGLYFMKSEKENSVFTKKLIIQKE